MDPHTCPNCHIEKYDYDGEKLRCMKCPQDEFMSALFDSEGDLLYRELINAKSAFFQLETGKRYDCTAHFENKSEKVQIIPVAYRSNGNKLFFLLVSSSPTRQSREYIDVILSRNFDELWADVVLEKNQDEKFNYPQLTNTAIGTTSPDGKIVMHAGFVLSDFRIQD